jgi:hypothetical protein
MLFKQTVYSPNVRIMDKLIFELFAWWWMDQSAGPVLTFGRIDPRLWAQLIFESEIRSWVYPGSAVILGAHSNSLELTIHQITSPVSGKYVTLHKFKIPNVNLPGDARFSSPPKIWPSSHKNLFLFLTNQIFLVRLLTLLFIVSCLPCQRRCHEGVHPLLLVTCWHADYVSNR